MQTFEFKKNLAERIEQFQSVGAHSVSIADGSGESRVYILYFDENSDIGIHRAGFDQLFIVVAGSGWACGDDDRRVALKAGQGAYFKKGEMHAKGSATGMTVVMIQASEFECTALIRNN